MPIRSTLTLKVRFPRFLDLYYLHQGDVRTPYGNSRPMKLFQARMHTRSGSQSRGASPMDQPERENVTLPIGCHSGNPNDKVLAPKQVALIAGVHQENAQYLCRSDRLT